MQRSAPFNLAAEIRRLLPLRLCVHLQGSAVHLRRFAGAGQPRRRDTFDYSVDREALHVSITDAMGHGVDATPAATQAELADDASVLCIDWHGCVAEEG